MTLYHILPNKSLVTRRTTKKKKEKPHVYTFQACIVRLSIINENVSRDNHTPTTPLSDDSCDATQFYRKLLNSC